MHSSGPPPIVLIFLAACVFVFIWLVKRLGRKPKRGQPIPEPIRIQPPRREPAVQPVARAVSQGEIFISYASGDRLTAELLASALSGAGWSVGWDRKIPPGKTFDEVIEAALDEAKCVVVLWSRASVVSDWVKGESADAAKRRILIPALIEDVKIPLEFRRLQTADLVGWQGSANHAGLRSLLESVADIVPKRRTSG